jgi:hypothetical protein
MSLSINEAKVAELLKSNKGYEGFTSDVLPMAIENCNPAYPATSAVYTAPVLVTAETRERLLSARRQIEESGVPLKSAEDLTREIDEMRGRR